MPPPSWRCRDARLDKRLKAWRAKQTKIRGQDSPNERDKHLAKPVPPGGVIGIIGGGQLGRMLAMAAARLGLKAAIYNDENHAPAFQVTPLQIAAPYDDRNMLTGFAEICDVITFEFENLPVRGHRPSGEPEAGAAGRRALEITQDRLSKKTLSQSLGLKTAPFSTFHRPRMRRDGLCAD